MESAYMCKDCCEVSDEKGIYENCMNCGSHRIFEIEPDYAMIHDYEDEKRRSESL